MNPLVERFGVSFMPGCLVERNENFLPNFIKARPTPEICELAYVFEGLLAKNRCVTLPGLSLIHIFKSVLGTLTEEENFVLEEWFQENARNRVLYPKLSSTVELKHKYKQYENIDVAGAFRRNQRRLYQNVPNRVLKRILPYAAVVLLLFGGVFCFLMNRSGEVREEVPVALSAGGKYAELILANGQKVDLHEGMEMKLRERSSNIQVKGNVVYYEENKDLSLIHI